jgi:hypothetical protein
MLNFLVEREGWKALCGLTYIIICLFDFVVVPSWYGLTRPDIEIVMRNLPQTVDVVVQLEYLKILTETHDPFTLKISGLFHVAFGALLTGSAIFSGHKKKLGNDDGQKTQIP